MHILAEFEVLMFSTIYLTHKLVFNIFYYENIQNAFSVTETQYELQDYFIYLFVCTVIKI